MEFGSVCSGIEAASVAWEPLGWNAAWFSEIEPFPSAALAHHWPDVPNHGDMLALPDKVARGEIPAPDALVGGTPCQAFSVAGRRGSLADERGSLTLAYVELANAIDRRRADTGRDACVIVWENVPGVLSTKDNAFGCFLAGLAGETEPLQPSGKKWTNAGCVCGPQRTVAWRVLDAQYFGVAQRRRRVFVVASAREGFDPVAVLFESEGVRRDSPPRREAREGATSAAGCGFETAGTLDARTRGGGFPGTDGACAGHVIPILEAGARTGKSTTDPRAGSGIGTDGDPMFTLQAGKQHGVAVLPGVDVRNGRLTGEVAHTVQAGAHAPDPGGTPHVLQAAYNVHENQRAECTLSDTAGAIKCAGGKPGQGYPAALTVALRGREGGATAELGGDTANALRASSGGGDKPHVLTVHGTQDPDVRIDYAHTLGRNNGAENAVCYGLAVRRLMPVECERLQGFPDGHTDVPYRGKPAADGPRYKAVGNSMAVPVMHWIGKRIDAQVGVTGFDLNEMLDFSDMTLGDLDDLLDLGGFDEADIEVDLGFTTPL